MSYSQFTSVEVTDPPSGPRTLPPNHVPVKVTGPLGLDKRVTYVMPITIVFSLIQNAKKPNGDIDHDATKASRVSGVVRITNPKATDWSSVIALDKTKFSKGSARGVGVAVLEQVQQFGIETITWCDHVELPQL
jgi:hypothetical protein